VPLAQLDRLGHHPSMRFGFRGRLFLVTLASILVVVGGGYWYFLTATEAGLLARLRTDLTVRAHLVMDGLNDAPSDTPLTLDNVEHWDALADHFGQVSQTRTTLMDIRGSVVGDSSVATADIAHVANHSTRPEVQSALHGRIGVQRRRSATVLEPLIYLAIPWERNGATIGVVRVALPATELAAAVQRLTRGLSVSLGVAFLVALLVSTVAAQLSSRTARELTEVAKQMSAGDLAIRSHVPGSDEFAVLGRALDGLAHNLSATLDQLRGERDRLESVLRSMLEGVLMLDEHETIVLHNTAFMQMLYLSPGIDGRKATDVIILDGFKTMVNEALGGNSVSGELQLREPTSKIFLTNVRPLARQKGVLVVLVDITEQRHLETVRQEFVANASHELRTPVAAILSAVETLQNAAADDPEATSSFLSMIERNADRLRTLVEDLLALSSIESGKLEVVLKPIPLRGAIENVLNNLTPQARRKGTNLLCRVPTNLNVMATESGLAHVFGNLVDNAIKYCPPNATVTVAAKPGDGVVIVTVTDTGPGIEAAHRERIFERFYRVDTGRSRAVGGTGLGLSIVKHWVEAMGGTIRVEAPSDGGTRFRVAFNDSSH
jgi:two-component system phosphate regulon sensor histidine kinase PhoR